MRNPASPPVRLAQPADLAAVAAVEAASFDHDPWTAPRLAALLDRGAAWLLVAGAPGAVVGHCLAQVIVDEAEILSLATHPRARGQGVGRALLAALARRGRNHGVATVFLDVSERNHAARRLYERAGYREVGRRRRYYADGADALLMRLDLAADGSGAA